MSWIQFLGGAVSGLQNMSAVEQRQMWAQANAMNMAYLPYQHMPGVQPPMLALPPERKGDCGCGARDFVIARDGRTRCSYCHGQPRS